MCVQKILLHVCSPWVIVGNYFLGVKLNYREIENNLPSLCWEQVNLRVLKICKVTTRQLFVVSMILSKVVMDDVNSRIGYTLYL